MARTGWIRCAVFFTTLSLVTATEIEELERKLKQAEALERAASPWAIGGETYGELALLAAIVAMTLLFMLPPAKANYSIDPGKASNRLHPRGLA